MKAILTRERPIAFKGGRWQMTTDRFEVLIMAQDSGYAMVRRIIGRRKCMPFVCETKELKRYRSLLVGGEVNTRRLFMSD